MANYAKESFSGYTHRFKVEFEVEGEEHTTNMDIYSDSGEEAELLKMIEEKKSKKVISYKVINRATKEQDGASVVMIQEFINDLKKSSL